MAPVRVFRFLFLSHLVLLISAGNGNGNHVECPKSFDCKGLGRIYFPFAKVERRDCGLIAVHNCDDPNPLKMIELEKNGKPFLQLNGILQQGSIITAFDQDLHNRLQSNNSCEAFNNNLAIPANSPLISFDIKYNSTLFKCDHNVNVNPPKGFVKHPCPRYDIYHYMILSTPNYEQASHFSACSTIVLPKKDLPDTTDLLSLLAAQMTLEVRLSGACDKCYNQEGGHCQLDSNNNFYCDKEHKSKVSKLALGAGLGFIGVVMLLFLACFFKRKFFPTISNFLGTTSHPTQQIIEAFLKEHGPLLSRRYNYFEIRKITNNFKIKLGQGGYGSVYKGKLQDGQLVAVKVLSKLEGTGEEFINEVASISQTSHVNIVNLLGFCFQGFKTALVYEFMPNGSLEKFIHDSGEYMLDHELACKTLYDIAIGVARGLEYLHRGCNTRILHFDIKPHNILLDEDFCPKISDFGLAKVCPRKESIVSLLGARGTVGFIAPEVFSRCFGRVSTKSDVYSYGMMIIDMVGGRKNKNVEVDCFSEVYFPHWIYKCLELNQEPGLKCIKNEADKEIIRKMTLVSLWCIQTDPSTRPTMSKVVEMLEGSLESLQVPPKPYLSSPSTSPVHYSTQTQTL